MSEREARMLGAGDTVEVETVDSKGKKKKNKYRLRPVRAKHLVDLEKDALTSYKKEYLGTFSSNVYLFPSELQQDILLREVTKVASWDLSNLPQKDTYDISHLAVTPKMTQWVKEQFNDEAPDNDVAVRALVANALENGSLTVDEIEKMSEGKPKKMRVRYDQWWVTATVEGMIAFVVNSVKHDHPELTRESIEDWPFSKIVEAARIVESITSASLGNG